MHYIQILQNFMRRWRQSHPPSVTSSIGLAWGCGQQNGLSNFQTVPRFIDNTSSPLPCLHSTFLSERGTLITSGIFSSNRLKLGLSLSVGSTSTIFSVLTFNNYANSKFMQPFPASSPNTFPASYVVTLAEFLVGEPSYFIKLSMVL